jgi:hypothetical protein
MVCPQQLAHAQDTSVSVPDLHGLSIARAAVELNRAGLVLGSQINEQWVEASQLPQNSISSQSIPAGQTVPTGSAVDVTVLRSPNVTFAYDENDFTIINQTGGDLRLDNLTFQATEGSTAALNAGRWAGGLRSNYCVQVWSIRRGAPKDVEGCEQIQNWFTNASNPGEHFWTGLNGVIRFSVFQDGVQRGVCDAAPGGSELRRCQVYVPAANADDTTKHIYLAYTTSRLIIRNNSEDRWMPLRSTTVLNNNPNLTQLGLGVPIGDPTLYLPMNPAATVEQLAPGQCVLFTNSTSLEADNLPEACDVIARLDVGTNLVFWAAEFNVVSTLDGQRRNCPAATDGRLTLCLVTR